MAINYREIDTRFLNSLRNFLPLISLKKRKSSELFIQNELSNLKKII